MKKFTVPLILLCLALCFTLAALQISAEESAPAEEAPLQEADIPDDTLVTYGYLKQLREELKKEILAELASQGEIEIGTGAYREVTAQKGQIIVLSKECEIIYRGGNAVAITASDGENCGITDMSAGKELFSGDSLEYGHIYFASASDSEKAVLVIGEMAYFTVRGDYELV